MQRRPRDCERKREGRVVGFPKACVSSSSFLFSLIIDLCPARDLCQRGEPSHVVVVVRVWVGSWDWNGWGKIGGRVEISGRVGFSSKVGPGPPGRKWLGYLLKDFKVPTLDLYHGLRAFHFLSFYQPWNR